MARVKQMLVSILMLAGATAASADIYDVLNNTQNANNLTYNDVQKAGSPPPGGPPAAPGDANGLPTTDSTTFKPTTLRDEAFKELVNKNFPLLPSQIKQLHQHFDDEQLAIRSPAYTPPQPVSSTLTVDLSPGATPPVVRLATGFVTSIVFVDSTGSPWPVADFSLGNPTTFNIKWDSKTNALFLQSVKEHATGNMAVRLGDLETPIMISLVTGQKEVDYRVDFQVPGSGPNAGAPVLDMAMPGAASASLMAALDGVPPTGSIELNVAKDYGRAWVYNGKLLFRTKLSLLSPAWSAVISGPDGTRVYELVQTPLIIASQNGKPVKIELSGL